MGQAMSITSKVLWPWARWQGGCWAAVAAWLHPTAGRGLVERGRHGAGDVVAQAPLVAVRLPLPVNTT